MTPTTEVDSLEYELVKKGFPEHTVTELFQDYQPSQTVIRLHNSNPERDGDTGKITLEEYQNILGVPTLQQRLPEFIRKYEDELKDAQKTYGVDYRYIAGIIGIESSFGQNTGGYNLPNTLKTLYNEVPRRRNFAKKQARCLLEYMKRKELAIEDIKNLKGSYAGAIGYGQFIPCSLSRLFKGDVNSMEDTIKSIANYLKNNNMRHPETNTIMNWDPRLNGEEIDVREGNYFAIFAYNRNWMYVLSVRDVAETVSNALNT